MTTWYLAIRRHGSPPTDEPAIETHLRWMREQHAAGTILMSGPSSDHAISLYVIRADSRQAAADIAARDPLAGADSATIEIVEWEVHQLFGIGAFDLESIRRLAELA